MSKETLIEKLVGLKYEASSGIDPLCVATNNDAVDKCVAIVHQYSAAETPATEQPDELPGESVYARQSRMVREEVALLGGLLPHEQIEHARNREAHIVELESRLKRESGSRYKAAYEAYHLYVHASNEELIAKGMSRTDALNAANRADVDLHKQGRLS